MPQIQAATSQEIPPWLEVMRSITGLSEWEDGSNPRIEAMAAYIGRKFPPQAGYASAYTDDSIAWCGVTAAFCMAVCDISGPFGPTDTDRWMWALSWGSDPNYRHLAQPSPGCWVVMEREGGGPITCFEEWVTPGVSFKARGGNQSNAVNVQTYDVDDVVAWAWPVSVTPPTPAPAPRRELAEGDRGADVAALQASLGVYPTDGDFGSITDSAVRGFQAASGLVVDGVVGDQTWAKIDALDERVAKCDAGLPRELVSAIIDTAENSAIARYQWQDRGQAPLGYTSGVALCFALALDRLNSEDDAAYEMARVNEDDEDTDVFSWYEDEFDALGLSNDEDVDAEDRLINLFALMLGLGMMESSGRYCEGRDQSVPPGYYGPPADTTETSCWQTSWDIRSCSSNIGPLLDYYLRNPCGFRETFQKGVSLHNNDELTNWGTGPGTQYQWCSKFAPALHAFVTALGLRSRRQHWGPINKKAAELKREAVSMLQAVRALVEEGVEPEPEPEPPEPGENRVDITATHPREIEVVITGDVEVTINGKPWP